MLAARRLVVAVTLATAAGCGDDGGGGPPPSCLPDCPGSRAYDAQAYHLRARFDAAARVLVASEDVTLGALDSSIVALDAELDVTAVHAGDQALAFAVDTEAHTLRVDVGPARTGDSATFTVDYTAPLSDALALGGARDDDPVRSQVLYTDSEPDRGLRWLVAKHDPADRARFSSEITVAAGDDVVGNGTRVRDELVDGARVVGYRLEPPIPTYLMAFAAGALEHTERTTGRVPLAVWHRRGLLIDPNHTLDVVADAMATFERLVGPYPFERYAVVLLPQFGGGMENATITFNDERSGQGVVNFNLNAHELAHQWFGDQVTMRTYDDLWTKEGMATFLAVEADRARRDLTTTGRYFGSDFFFLSSSAVVDPALTGLAKYNDGPYDRAAWVITQIRRRIGEDAFWTGLRKVLADHHLDSVDSEGFVRAFAPALDEATIQRVLASLRAKVLPRVNLLTTASGGALDVTAGLEDPSGVAIAPIELTVVDAAGAAVTRELTAATSMFTIPAGGYVATDERGVHPSWPRTFGTLGADYGRLSARFGPVAPGASPVQDAYLGRSTVHQERTVFGSLPVPAPADVRAVYDALDSVTARETFLVWVCARMANEADPAGLATAIEPLLRAPALARYNSGFMRCPTELARRVFVAERAAAVVAPTAANAARLEYLVAQDLGTATNFADLTRLATTAPSLRLRERALQRMVAETSTGAPHRLPAADVPTWRAFFRSGYAAVTSQTRLMLLWGGTVNLADVEALPVVAPLLHRVAMSEFNQWLVVCDAHAMTGTDPAVWARFQQDTMPWETLAPSAAAALADPVQCDDQRRAPRPEAGEAVDERGRLDALARGLEGARPGARGGVRPTTR